MRCACSRLLVATSGKAAVRTQTSEERVLAPGGAQTGFEMSRVCSGSNQDCNAMPYFSDGRLRIPCGRGKYVTLPAMDGIGPVRKNGD